MSREGQKANRSEQDLETTQQFKLELTKEHTKQEFDPRQSKGVNLPGIWQQWR